MAGLQIGIAGLGRMGSGMARRLHRQGAQVVVWNRHPGKAEELARDTGMTAASTLAGLVAALAPPRTVWLMLPAGAVTAQHVTELLSLLEPGDVLVNGANAHYRDSIAEAGEAAGKGVHYMDAGVSGGVWGLEEGFALMVGGTPEAALLARPFLERLSPAPDRGWLHCGPAGSGHFVKMVHNGIEYGMMQALAEGFALLEGQTTFPLDLAAIAGMWRHGSVVRSWLLDLTAGVLASHPDMDGIAPVVADSGEGLWTAQAALEQRVPAPVITLALQMRWASQGKNGYADRLLALMRNRFGGHEIQKEA